MPRVLLLVPTTTYRARDFLNAAQALDVEIVIGSDGRQTLEDVMGERALVLPLAGRGENGVAASVSAIADAHARTPFDAIVGIDDGGIVLAAAASERLSLAANDAEAVRRTRDKREQRRVFGDAGVPQPRYTILDADDVRRLLADGNRENDDVIFPAVLKPPGLSGSRGVIRIDTPDELRAAARRIVDIVGNTPEAAAACAGDTMELLLEEFVAGPEVAVEGVVRSGHVQILAVFDKPDPLDGPYFEETIYVTPSRHSDRDLHDLEEIVADGVAALGLTEGPVHAEARLGDQGVRLLEVAARSIGGLCSRALRFGVGVTLEEVLLRHALGLPVPVLVREGAASGVMMLPIPQAGTLRGVHGVDEARAVPGVVGLETTIPPGSAVEPLPEGDRYLGFLFARGDDPRQVEAALRRAHAHLEIEIV